MMSSRDDIIKSKCTPNCSCGQNGLFCMELCYCKSDNDTCDNSADNEVTNGIDDNPQL